MIVAAMATAMDDGRLDRPGSLGTLELSEDGADLARRWGARRGDPVLVELY